MRRCDHPFLGIALSGFLIVVAGCQPKADPRPRDGVTVDTPSTITPDHQPPPRTPDN